MIEEAKLDELAALAQKATPGPWFYRDSPWTGTYAVQDLQRVRPLQILLENEDDARFIAAANPTTIAQLVEEVKAYRRYQKAAVEWKIAYAQALTDYGITNLREVAERYSNDPDAIVEHAKALATKVDEDGVIDHLERTGRGSFDKHS